MLTRLKQYTDPLIFVLLLPVGLSIVAFYGFTSGYTTGIFTHEEFVQQFTSNIYKYRILGTKLHGLFYNFLKDFPLPQRLPSFIEAYCPNSVDPVLYSSVFYFNMVFMVLLSLVVYLTIRKRVPEPMSTFAVLMIQLLVTLSSFVFIHYDVISCFFLCLAFYLIYFGKFRGTYIVVAVVLLLASPYILAILIVGVQMEIRLWTPIWILLILIGLTGRQGVLDSKPTENRGGT